MIKKFDIFNESIRDKMTSKDLSPNAQMFYDAVNDIKNLGYEIIELKSNNKGQYQFEFRDESEIDNDRYVGVKYKDKKEIEKTFKTASGYPVQYGWFITVYHSFTRTNSIEEVNVDSWDKALLEIIYELYPNMDDTIKKTKQFIKYYEQLLINLEKRNKILNDL